jgi:hypothetical protein
LRQHHYGCITLRVYKYSFFCCFSSENVLAPTSSAKHHSWVSMSVMSDSISPGRMQLSSHSSSHIVCHQLCELATCNMMRYSSTQTKYIAVSCSCCFVCFCDVATCIIVTVNWQQKNTKFTLLSCVHKPCATQKQLFLHVLVLCSCQMCLFSLFTVVNLML